MKQVASKPRRSNPKHREGLASDHPRGAIRGAQRADSDPPVPTTEAAPGTSAAPARGTPDPFQAPDSRIRLPGKLVHWPIDRLKPYERNPRTHGPEQITKIAASLLEFGWTNPILVDGEAGPKGAFENGNVGAVTRRVAVERVVLGKLEGRSRTPRSSGHHRA